MQNSDETWQDVRRKLSDYLRSRVNEDVVEDLAHDILLGILQNEEKFLEADNPVAWMYSVARNRLIDHYRKQGRNREQQDEDSIVQQLADCHSMPDCVDTDFSEWLLPLAEQLEPAYRDALVAVDFRQTSQVELARKSGVPLSTLKSRVQRARSQLKGKLLACCSFEVDRFGKPIDYRRNEQESGDSCC